MNHLIYTVFGYGKDLNSLQMGSRALVMFFITLALLRFTGMRSLGQRSAFDAIIVIMLGSLLSRAVVGVSPFLPTVVAGTVMAATHKIIAIITVKNDVIGRLVKGQKRLLFQNDKYIEKNMLSACVSYKDLQEDIRLNNEDSTENIKEIYMERSGHVSIVKKTESSP